MQQHEDVLPVSRLEDDGDGGCSVLGSAGDSARVWSSSSAMARRVCPRERATARGRRPNESGIPKAELFQLYRSSAALWWPNAHAHICNTAALNGPD